MPVPELQSLTPPASLVMRGVDWSINRRAARHLKLEIRINDPSRLSQIGILNSGNRPIIIHAIDWRIGRRRNRRSFDSTTWDEELLPNRAWELNFSPHGVFRNNVYRYSEGKDMHTLRFRVHTSSARMTRSWSPSSIAWRAQQPSYFA